MSIEYVTAQWNPFTGCLHGKDICATSATCWARTMSKRFEKVCGGDFQPRFHPGRLDAPLHWKKPRRVAVCFCGDLWGDWERAADSLDVTVENYMADIQHDVLGIVRQSPQHQFLFLTKRPENLAQWNPWPVNAWVGCSITGAETPERQGAMLEALHRVEGAGVRWLSHEPALGPLKFSLPDWLNWSVVGAQSGKGAKPFDLRWLGDPPLDGHAYWLKNNLARYLNRPLTQELPTP